MRRIIGGRRTAPKPPQYTPEIRRMVRQHATEKKLLNLNLGRSHDGIDEAWRKADPYGSPQKERAWLKGLILLACSYGLITLLYFVLTGHLPRLMRPDQGLPARLLFLYLCAWLVAKAMLCGPVRVDALPVHGRRKRR